MTTLIQHPTPKNEERPTPKDVASDATAQVTTPPATTPTTKHKRTWGETLFNTTTYAGLALVGNEATATWILEQDGRSNLMGRAIRSCGEFFKKIGTPGKLPYLQKRINYINFAIIGGFTMVPFIKFLEDNKGRCVRFADNLFYGDRAKTDPEIAQKHEEMDNAPKQTWGSLGKGRLLTVAAAYTVDSTINWKEGLTARWLKGTRFENYASLEHLSGHTAEWASKKLSQQHSIPAKFIPSQKSLFNLIGLTTLSATLTVLFYFSSKLFAKKREEKIERREQARVGGSPLRDETAESPATTLTEDAPSAAVRPAAQVNSVAHEKTLAPAPELAPAV